MTAKPKEGIKVCLSKSNDPSLYLLLRSSQFTTSRGFLFISLSLWSSEWHLVSANCANTSLSANTMAGFTFPCADYLTCLTVLVIKFIFSACPSLGVLLAWGLKIWAASIKIVSSNPGRDKIWPGELQRFLPAQLWLCCCVRHLGHMLFQLGCCP